MNNTIEITIDVTDNSIKELLIAELSEIGFEGFEEKDEGLLAFIPEISYDEESLKKCLSLHDLSFTQSVIEEQNWNALWESNFDPVVVENFCAIRAEFHNPFPDIKHEIVITPKMSFGTGHHATTYMMIREMDHLNFLNKQVADFGTGTGVLAILAEKLGSSFVWATDHDDWSIENSLENIQRNNCRKIKIEKADSFSASQKFDIILANINKSVILDNLESLATGLNADGKLLLSGLLQPDEQDLLDACRAHHLKHYYTVSKNGWICLLFGFD